MVSGILWIPDLQTFMLTFEFTDNFVYDNQLLKSQMNQVPLMKKLEIIINKMFLLFGVTNHKKTRLCHSIAFL